MKPIITKTTTKLTFNCWIKLIFFFIYNTYLFHIIEKKPLATTQQKLIFAA